MAMQKTPSVFQFQCISGRHMGVILPNTELAAKAGAADTVDALILGGDDCPSCVERSRESARQMWSMLGCPTHEDEHCQCPPPVIPDSPYDSQIGECTDLDEDFDQ